MNEMIKKIAQRRSIWNQIRPSNITRQIGKLNPQYREQYEKLVAADEAIRKIKGPEGADLETLLKELKRNNKGHRWLAVLDRAARINNIVSQIVNNENVLALNEGREESMRDFYFTDQDAKGRNVNMDYINELATASAEDIELIKQALFGDIPRKITDKFLSSFYDKKEREIRRHMNSVVNRAETLARRTLEAYNELDTARAKGNIGDYINILSNLRKEQQRFESSYKATYESIKDFLPKEQEKPPVAEQTEEPQQTEEPVTDAPVATAPPVAPPAMVAPRQPEQGYQDETLGPEGLGGQQQAEQQLEPLELVPPFPQPPQAPQRSNLPEPPPRPRYDWEANIKPQYYEQMQQDLATTAKRAIMMGEYGVAVALLSKYSQELENKGDIEGSAKILSIAMEILNEQ